MNKYLERIYQFKIHKHVPELNCTERSIYQIEPLCEDDNETNPAVDDDDDDGDD